MPSRYLGRDLARQRWSGREVNRVRSLGRVIFAPVTGPSRLSVAQSLTIANTAELLYHISNIPTAGRYSLSNSTAFTTADLIRPGDAFTGLVRVFVNDADVDTGAALPDNILIWSSSDDWAILDVTAQASLGSAHFYTGTLGASSGLVRDDAAIYLGDTTDWPLVDDGTLADVHQDVLLTGVELTTTTVSFPAGVQPTFVATLEPVGANAPAPLTYQWLLGTTPLTTTVSTLTITLTNPGTRTFTVNVTDGDGTVFTDSLEVTVT